MCMTAVSLYIKLRLYNGLVVSVLLHGAETWTLTRSDEQKLEAFQRGEEFLEYASTTS